MSNTSVNLHMFLLIFRYEIDAVRQSILSGELENKVMPHSTTLRIMEYVDEIALQLGMKL